MNNSFGKEELFNALNEKIECKYCECFTRRYALWFEFVRIKLV